MLLNGSTLLPDTLPLGVVAKVISYIAAILIAYGSVNAEIRVLRTEIDHLNQRMERIEDKLDRVLLPLPK